jgi:hypothetical protein
VVTNNSDSFKRNIGLDVGVNSVFSTPLETVTSERELADKIITYQT